VCVFGGILWVFFNRQFDIYSRSRAHTRRLGCVPTTHTSPPPPGESSRVHWPLGLAKSPLSPFPRGRSQHTHAIGEKAAAALERPSRPPPLFMGWVTKKKPKTTLLTYDPIPLSCVAGWLVGVHTPPHPPNLPPVETPKGKKSPQDQVSGESRSVAPAQQYYSLRSSRHIPLGHLLRVLSTFFFLLNLSQLISSSVTHLVTFEKIILEKFRVCDKRSIF
jgi:hypothetical protein